MWEKVKYKREWEELKRWMEGRENEKSDKQIGMGWVKINYKILNFKKTFAARACNEDR